MSRTYVYYRYSARHDLLLSPRNEVVGDIVFFPFIRQTVTQKV